MSDEHTISEGVAVQLPRYKCHKEVYAAKITEITDPTEPGNESDGSRVLKFGEVGAFTRVDHNWVRKHEPKVGGYYVVYDDGYTSFSPAAAFEDGYTRI